MTSSKFSPLFALKAKVLAAFAYMSEHLKTQGKTSWKKDDKNCTHDKTYQNSINAIAISFNAMKHRVTYQVGQDVSLVRGTA